MDNTINIKSRTIKTDGVNTIITNNLQVTFKNAQDKTNFEDIVTELGIGEDPQAQLYLLESMSFAGVSYDIQ